MTGIIPAQRIRLSPAAKKRRRMAAGCAVLLLVILAACLLYVGDFYRADEAALEALRSPAASVTVEERADSRIVFLPDAPAAGLVFYPGGKVQYEAYAPLMEACAERGILCVLLHMPGNLAVLDRNAAVGVTADYPFVADWYIGGHSLGGVMAAAYAAEHPGEYAGLVLLASYSTRDLSESGLRVLSMYGTEDGVLNREKYAQAFANLPPDRVEIVLDGGCHAYFGSYGAQKGDGSPSLSPAEQITQTADAIAALCLFTENHAIP